SKHFSFAGPLNMGLLRGLNLLLGLSFVPAALTDHFMVSGIPMIYIFAITMVSRGEVHGSSARPLSLALLLFIVADTCILVMGFRHDRVWLPVLFVGLHLFFILPTLFKAL